jgi:hypothetical protein
MSDHPLVEITVKRERRVQPALAGAPGRGGASRADALGYLLMRILANGLVFQEGGSPRRRCLFLLLAPAKSGR